MSAKWIMTLMAAALIVMAAQAANAELITIANSSFEAPTVSGRFSGSPITSWTKFGNQTYLLSSTASTLIHPFDGTQLVEIQGNTTDTGFFQVLSAVYDANTKYTLSMVLGGFTGSSAANYGGIWLQTSSGTTLESATLLDPEYQSGGTADHGTISLEYTTPASGGPVGETIRVSFGKVMSLSTTNATVAFDNITLDATPIAVPEPASLTLLGLVALCLLGRRRRLQA